jgi:pSer/pThr/pTyr-binding forkhead associated (FHA) protein
VQFQFTHLSGALQGQSVTVETVPILIGRDDGCAVQLDKMKDLAVSSQHAQIDMVSEGVFQLANLSRNATWVNGVVVEASIPLPNHSVIQLGRDGPRIRFDVNQSFGGISFAEEKQRKTAKLDKSRLGPAPATEERPVFKIDDAKESAGEGIQISPVVIIVAAVVILLVGIVYVVFAR